MAVLGALASFVDSLVIRHTLLSTTAYRPPLPSLSLFPLRDCPTGYAKNQTRRIINIITIASIRADENENNFYDQDDPSNVDIHDILAGEVTADLSHAGGKFAELLAIEDGLFGPVSR